LESTQVYRALIDWLEMFAEGVIDLFHSGAITNMKKSFLPGKILTSFVMVTFLLV
jgi:acyl-CoA hydrolase